jgi:hypothetical protein
MPGLRQRYLRARIPTQIRSRRKMLGMIIDFSGRFKLIQLFIVDWLSHYEGTRHDNCLSLLRCTYDILNAILTWKALRSWFFTA